MPTLLLQAELSRLFPYLVLRHFSVPEEVTFQATPNNSYELLLVLSGEITLATTAQQAVRLRPAALLGMNAEAMRFTLGKGAAGLHLRFEPHRLRPFVHLPLRELAQQPLDMADVWGAPITHLQERMAGAPDLAAKRGLAEDFLARLYRPQDTRVARQVAALAETGPGELSVKRVREALSLSERQLERLFAEQVGSSPRTYLKISRFQRVVARFSRYRNGPPKPALLPLALEAGYYDQSHFIRDCKQLTGRTPEAYFAGMDPVLSGSYNTGV